MKLLTISNLYPRPDQPQRGMFNAQLFGAISEQISIKDQSSGIQNVCLVPEWRFWRWPAIRKWSNEKSELSVQTFYLPVFYVPVIGRSLNWWTYLLLLRSLRNIVQDSDVVLSTWLYPDGVAATRFAEEAGVPAWIMVQGSDTFHLWSRLRRRVILDACRKAEGIICVCKKLADRLLDAGVDSAKVHVVPNGVNGELFKYRTKEEALKGLESRIQNSESRIRGLDTRIILFVGNLVHVKGPDIMLEAFALLRKAEQELKPQMNTDGHRPEENHSDFRSQVSTSSHSGISGHLPGDVAGLNLLFIGDGPMRKKLERQAKEFGIAESVSFLGSRPHEEVALWMNIADCLCLSSRGEGMPNVVIEALASGLPVVATDVGGVRELLENRPESRIIPVSGPDPLGRMIDGAKFARSVAEVIQAEVSRRESAESVKGSFSWKDKARQMIEILTVHKVMGSKQ